MAFFGEASQKKLAEVYAIIVGVGGVGSHVAQQLAYLGVRTIMLIDADLLEHSNRNRLIGVRDCDEVGTAKVDIVKRHIKSINESLNVDPITGSVISERGIQALRKATVVFGCVDDDGPRQFLNEFCQAYKLLYIDIASEIDPEGGEYGGRVVVVSDERGCLFCRDEIDSDEARIYFENPEARKDREAIYGVGKKNLNGSGPSVVCINGVISSIAVTEFMLHQTGKRPAGRHLVYRGSRSIVSVIKDQPDYANCYYCSTIRGLGSNAGLTRYLD